uniref:Uncharacterized protein n=1 Tax=Tanacetum cinerariifolium TaxID=118510 RepID=A0A699XCI5_TANCI|nr:hypothetical protein [Tanacetum cinerariifolium]
MGEANVLSTQSKQLCALAIAEIAAISDTFSVGLEGDSNQMSLVLSVMVLAMFSALVVSQYTISMPRRRYTCSNKRKAPP